VRGRPKVALIEGFGILLRCLYPATPHLAHMPVVATGLRNKHLGDLLDAPWPQVDPDALVQDEIELMLQVNGKLRGSIHVPAQRRQGRDRSASRWPARPSLPRPLAQRPSG
jgi:leucyl-tRNA synthetase